MNTEAYNRLLEAAKAMVTELESEFFGGCPSSLIEPWEELERAILIAEYAEPKS